MCVPKEVFGKESISLLTCCIPNLELDELLLEVYVLEFKVSSNGALAGERNKTVYILEEKRRLTNERVTHHKHLKKAIISGGLHFSHYYNHFK